MSKTLTNKDKIENNKRDKVTITFAIDESTLNQIKKDAESEGLSVNSKANHILKKYALFYRYTEVDRPVIIPSTTFSFTLGEVDEKKLVEEYKRILVELLPEVLVRLNLPITFENWVKYVFGSMVIYTGAIQAFEYFKDDQDRLNLVFTHRYGIKFSKVIKEAYGHAIESLFGYHIASTILPNNVVLRITEKNVANIIVTSD